MLGQLIDILPGLRCRSIRHFQHSISGRASGDFGPIEFNWTDGTSLTLDARTDWTLELSGRRWVDPFEGASTARREELATEVGLWEEVPVPDALGGLVGQAVVSAEPELNEVGELVGLTLAFEAQTVCLRVIKGELTSRALA